MSAKNKFQLADLLGSIVGGIIAVLILGIAVSCSHKETPPFHQTPGDDPQGAPTGPGQN